MIEVSTDTTPVLGGNLDFSDEFMYETFNAFSDADTDPDVSVGTNFKTANTGATTIADLDAGGGSLVEGQWAFIFIADSNTTIDLFLLILKTPISTSHLPA